MYVRLIETHVFTSLTQKRTCACCVYYFIFAFLTIFEFSHIQYVTAQRFAGSWKGLSVLALPSDGCSSTRRVNNWRGVNFTPLHCLRSPKDGYYSTSDDLSCSSKKPGIFSCSEVENWRPKCVSLSWTLVYRVPRKWPLTASKRRQHVYLHVRMLIGNKD